MKIIRLFISEQRTHDIISTLELIGKKSRYHFLNLLFKYLGKNYIYKEQTESDT